VVYLLAYLFYGFVTVALGATAPDTSAAQNYSRPMFMVLLAAFFAALAGASGAQGLDWLVYAPPFTPFMLLLKAPSLATELAALGLLTAAAVAAGWLAVRALTLKAPNARLVWSPFWRQ
jgi:ABC-type Na+ efflux pump permease subunit